MTLSFEFTNQYKYIYDAADMWNDIFKYKKRE
jgi:hypothetical protein